MTSIKEWQDSMSDVDGWAEAVDYIDEDDVKRWTADKKMNPQKFKSALAFSLTSDTMRVHLFADNVFLRAHAASTCRLRGPAMRNRPRCPPVPPGYFELGASRLIRRVSSSCPWA